jgi:hypothetical protein
MPKITQKEARKIVDQEWNASKTPFAREITPDSKGRYSVSVRADEYLFKEAVAYIVKHSAERAASKVNFYLGSNAIPEFQFEKEQKKKLNFESNATIKENCALNLEAFSEERRIVKIQGGKETVHGHIFPYADEQTLANTARNYQYDFNKIQNRKN